MSDIEKPWVERRRSGPPSSCPVCGAATMEVRIAGVITCRTSGLDHFEWRPDAEPVVSVESERVDQATFVRLAAGPCSACADGCTRPGAAAPCCPHPGCDPNWTDDESVPPCPVHDADNQRYDKPLTTDLPDEVWVGHFGRVDLAAPPLTEAEVAELPEGAKVTVIWSGGNGPHNYMVAIYEDGTRCAWVGVEGRTRAYNPLRFVGQERFHTRVWLRDEPPATAPLEGEIMGRDFVETAERRLHPDAAALASLHRPVFGRPPYCWACSTAGRREVHRVGAERRAKWPCSTASLALEMMGLTASDIAITEE